MKASTAATAKSEARRLVTQYMTARVIAESATAAQGIPKILHVICEGMEWEYGAVWCVDRPGTLRLLASWQVPGVSITELPGDGLRARVSTSREPVWLTGAPDHPEPGSLEAGSAAGFPIVLGGEVLGVMEFFTRIPRKRDEPVLQSLRVIA